MSEPVDAQTAEILALKKSLFELSQRIEKKIADSVNDAGVHPAAQAPEHRLKNPARHHLATRAKTPANHGECSHQAPLSVMEIKILP
eukprot:TRINITY_DN6675_c0_g1_i9.p1 TRINITY_DN6675_c0_g1~~TRINITY_DN6675_c0_g1_i9.p1  ORF type:complete len:101 (+),score=10.10 TRINITY_DN6675_c0_g1_i9:43-303(+)